MELSWYRTQCLGNSADRINDAIDHSSIKDSRQFCDAHQRQHDQSLQDLVEEVQERMGDALDTRVTISGLPRSNSRGTIVIEAADAEDLRRIADAIAGPALRL